jgi:hypothetical protein
MLIRTASILKTVGSGMLLALLWLAVAEAQSQGRSAPGALSQSNTTSQAKKPEITHSVGRAHAQTGARSLVVTPVGAPEVLYDAKRDGCDPFDIPDSPFRAFKGAQDQIIGFGLNFENRRLAGPSFTALKLDCRIAFRSEGKPDAKAYNDRSWISALYAMDPKTVYALGHHEFQASEHKGACRFKSYMECWWNSIIGLRSTNGGVSFTRIDPVVIAASPFGHEVDQGRHRGFFHPSNIIAKDGAYYTLIATTGWKGQKSGVCLFRTRELGANARWQAYAKGAFSAEFPDPYQSPQKEPRSCETIGPFPTPVASLSRHRDSGLYLAVFQIFAGTKRGADDPYPVSGFYTATSRDLITWSEPTLLLETPTLYDNACGAEVLRSYPSLIDPLSQSRNFEDVGETAYLTYSEMRVEGCAHTADRMLTWQKVRIAPFIAQ